MADPSPTDLARAARALVERSLRVAPEENVVVVCDAESAALAEVIARAAEGAGAQVSLMRLDRMRSQSTNHTGERPHKVLPEALRRAMNAAQSCAYIASAPHAEQSMREQLFHIVETNGVRQAHMPDITSRAFAQSFAIAYDRVALWGRGIKERLELAHRIDTESPAGTQLHVTLGDPVRWLPRLGEIAPGKCVALPAGAIFGVPLRIDGIFVANASVGEFFGRRQGLLLQSPVRFVIDDGRVTKAEAPLAPELEKDLRSMLALAPNSDRVGLVAVGVNMGIEVATGVSAIDENMPGLHLVIGDPAGRHTGVPWSARTTFVACQAGSRVSVDGTLIIDAGKIVSVV